MPRPRIDAAGLGGSERMGFKGSRVRIPPSRPSSKQSTYGDFEGLRKEARIVSSATSVPGRGPNGAAFGRAVGFTIRVLSTPR